MTPCTHMAPKTLRGGYLFGAEVQTRTAFSLLCIGRRSPAEELRLSLLVLIRKTSPLCAVEAVGRRPPTFCR